MSLYEDVRGHSWTSIEPQNGDPCTRCGLLWMHAAQHVCHGMNPNGLTPPPVIRGVELERLVGSPVTPPPSPAPAPAESPKESAQRSRWEVIEKEIRRMFEEDLEVLRERAFEYGSDLRIQGKSMESLLPGADQLTSEAASAAGIEMVIGSYVMGKSARLFGAWEKGHAPRLDSWRDMNCFSYMARVVRSTGGWL